MVCGERFLDPCVQTCAWKWSRWEWGVINTEPPPRLLVCSHLRLLFIYLFLVIVCVCFPLFAVIWSSLFVRALNLTHQHEMFLLFLCGPDHTLLILIYLFLFFCVWWFIFQASFLQSLSQYPLDATLERSLLEVHLCYVTPGLSPHLTSALVYSERSRPASRNITWSKCRH